MRDMWMLDRPAKADVDRERWQFVPFERVGPLSFGMTPDETAGALGLAAGSWLSGPVSGRRLLLYDAGIKVYFDEEFGLAWCGRRCVRWAAGGFS